MHEAVFLDTTPLGLISQDSRRKVPGACQAWIRACRREGRTVYIPEIADYEVRRELLRAGATAGVARLDALKAHLEYVPIRTEAMLRAASLWADVRRAGRPTADAQALDGDVILAAQALTCGRPLSEIIVATSNPTHISRFVTCDLWENIVP